MTNPSILFSSNLLIFHAAISYSDFFLLYYNCTSVLLLLAWRREKDDGYLILAALLAGLATFVKLEALSYLMMHLVLVVAITFSDFRNSIKEKFIQTWGVLGGNWGINRTMAQIHALLLVSHISLSAEDIMEDLQIEMLQICGMVLDSFKQLVLLILLMKLLD